LIGSPALDLCSKSDAFGAAWEGQKITVGASTPKPDGLNYGEVSTHVFLPVPTSAGTKYQFRILPVGGSCDTDAGIGVSIPAGTNTSLRQGGGLTLAVVGDVNAPAGSDASPKAVVVSDVVAPPTSFALLRAIHGVPDMPAFDVLISGASVITGVRFGSGIGYPYSSFTGFVNIAGGIPANSTVTLQAGTSVRNFTLGDRVRSGVAETLFVSGRLSGTPPLTATLCSDRSPPQGDVVATCTNLPVAK
jgi:hypothetical protein